MLQRQAQLTSNTAQEVDVQVPDIGVEKAIVGEILVQVGDAIDVDQSIIVVESDKATVRSAEYGVGYEYRYPNQYG